MRRRPMRLIAVAVLLYCSVAVAQGERMETEVVRDRGAVTFIRGPSAAIPSPVAFAPASPYAKARVAAHVAKGKETRTLRTKYSAEREVELLRWAVKCLVQKQPIPNAVRQYLEDVAAASR
jgi:hypothetical protein